VHVSSMVSGYTTLSTSANSCATSSTGTAGSSSGGASSGGSGGASGGDTTSGGATSGGATSSGSVATGQLIEPDRSYCEQPCPQNVQGPTTINVFFMLVGTDNSVAASAQWTGTFKLVGPQPPDKVSTGVGGNLLVINFSYSSATGTSPDTSANGFNIYCDPSPGTAAAADAGLLDPDGGPIVGNCGDNPPQVLFANDPVPDGKYLCGSAPKSSQSANATKLVNRLPYNVAVAAFDSYDNNGPLSQVTCGVPQEVTGFFKGYRDAGGRGGGGFCSFSRKPEPLTLVTLLGLASVLVFRRRRAA